MTILKDRAETTYKIDLREEKHNLEKIVQVPLITEHETKIRDNCYAIALSNGYFVLNMRTSTLADRLKRELVMFGCSDVYTELFKDLKRSSKGETTHKSIKSLLNTAYIDLRAYLMIASRLFLAGEQRYKLVLSKIKEIVPNAIFVEVSESVEQTARAMFFENLKHSHIVPSRATKLPDDVIEAALELGVNEVEIPIDYDRDRLLSTLSDYKKVIDYFNIEQRDFYLRFRKLGQTSANGLYHLPTRIILVDPRKTEVFYHELGHYIYEESVVFSYDNEIFEKSHQEYLVDQLWDRFIDQVRIHKYEEYQERSEVFARLFSEMCIEALRRTYLSMK